LDVTVGEVLSFKCHEVNAFSIGICCRDDLIDGASITFIGYLLLNSLKILNVSKHITCLERKEGEKLAVNVVEQGRPYEKVAGKNQTHLLRVVACDQANVFGNGGIKG
jgi:hypothetical protein